MRTNTKFRYKRKYEANPYSYTTSMFLFMKFIVGSDMRNQFLLISCCLTCHRPTKLFPKIEEWCHLNSHYHFSDKGHDSLNRKLRLECQQSFSIF